MEPTSEMSAPRRRGRPRRFIAPDRIERLRRAGLSFREIAKTTGLGYGTVRRAYGHTTAAMNAGAASDRQMGGGSNY
jgi:hypothetical protein